jgi:transposase InsO family protein
VARARRRYRCTTMSDHEQPVAANLLGREFTAARPNQRWIGDTTELVTPGARLFLAAILDLDSSYRVGWALSAVNDRHWLPGTSRLAHPGSERRRRGAKRPGRRRQIPLQPRLLAKRGVRDLKASQPSLLTLRRDSVSPSRPR